MKPILEDYRCSCGKLLLRGFVLSGIIEVKCRECKRLANIEGPLSRAENPPYILICDDAGKIQKASASAERATLFSPEELVGRDIKDVLMFTAPEFFRTLWDALSVGDAEPVQFDTLQKDSRRGLAPVRVESVCQIIAGTRHLVFRIVRKNAKHLVFDAGGSISQHAEPMMPGA